MAGRALVLVDTPAVSPGDEEGVKAFAADLRRLKGAEVHLCIPATLSAAAAKRVVAAFAPLKPAGIALTHVDETPQVGAVIELAITGGPALTFIGRDTGLEGGLELADPRRSPRWCCREAPRAGADGPGAPDRRGGARRARRRRRRRRRVAHPAHAAAAAAGHVGQAAAVEVTTRPRHRDDRRDASPTTTAAARCASSPSPATAGGAGRRSAATSSASARNVPVVVRDGGPDGPAHEVFSLNVSGNGLLLSGLSHLTFGDFAWVAIDLEDGTPPIEALVTVVREPDRGRRAVRIMSISARDEQRMVRFSFAQQQRARIARDA